MTISSDDIAAAIPRLAPDVERIDQDGVVRLRGRELRRSWIGRLLARLLRLPRRVTVELDEIGVYVIDRMDGRSLTTIAEDLCAHLRFSARESRVALTAFVRQLLERRLIRLDGLPERVA
jgi:hypothetical protein